MSKKKTKKESTVQSTLGDLVESETVKKNNDKKATPKKTTSKKSASKKATPKKSASKKATPKKPASKKTAPKKSKQKTSTKAEKTKPKAKTPKKKESSSKKTKQKKEETVSAHATEQGIPISKLPGVGSKLESKLIELKYDSVEKISRARAASLSMKIDGLSKSGAEKLVAAAKDLIKKSKKTEIQDIDDATDELPSPTVRLNDVPGVGSKMALALESAGYNSVARLSRSRPDAVASKVDGLSEAGASKIVEAAREMMRSLEIERITGETEPSTIVATGKTTKPTEENKEPVKKAPTSKKEKTKEESKKKAEEPKKTTERKAKKPAPPKKKKPKPIRKSSGLPVPKSVKKLTEELKKNWDIAEKREIDGDTPQIETVEVVSLTSDDTLERLVENAIEILNETMMTGRPAFEIPSRSSDNIVWDEIRDLLLLGMRTISRPYHSLASVVDATRTARVMEVVYNLLKANLHATKREVFYSDVNLFRDQKYSDKIIEDVSSMLKTTRDSVHIVASARGSAMGRVTIRDGGDIIDLTKMGTGGWAVTPFLDQLEIVESDAEFILLSEKDAAVMRLAESKYWNRQPCIVLTGKGSGDIATRAFLKMLVKELEIPAFALVDSDPYGHYIYSVFLRGSKRLSYESPFIATPELKLLGVLSRDLDEYNVPKSVRIPMQPTDIKRVRDMLKEPFVQQNKEWVKDLRLMLQIKEKAEIQAFASHSFQYLTDEYLPRKLETGDWI